MDCTPRPSPRRRHGRVRLHGGCPFPGLAHRTALLRPAAAAPDARPLRPGRDPRGAGRRATRLGVDRDRLDPAGRPRRHRPRRHLHARQHPRRHRRERAGGRQARAVREAARQHGGGGRGDGRGGRARGRARRPVDGRVHLPPRAGHRAGAPAGGAGTDRRDPARTRAVPPGLARGPVGPDDLAAREGQGRLRGAGRHRCAHRRPHAVHHRRPDRHRQRAARDVRAPAAGAELGAPARCSAATP